MNKGRAGDVAAVPMQLAGSGINFRSSKTPTMIREPQALIRGDYRLGSTFPGGPSDLQTDINREKACPVKRDRINISVDAALRTIVFAGIHP